MPLDLAINVARVPRMKALARGLCLAQLALTPPCHAQHPSGLPLRRITLYKSGVAWLERSGAIAAGQPLRLKVPPEEVNYILKSLRLSGEPGKAPPTISYGAADWLQQWKAQQLVFSGGAPSFSIVLERLAGERVKLTAGGRTATGRLLNFDAHPAASSEPGFAVMAATPKGVIALFTDHSSQGNPAKDLTTVQLLSSTQDNAIERYLRTESRASLQPGRSLLLNSTSPQMIHASYLQLVPVWKSSYRLRLFSNGRSRLEGWAVINNDTNEDWRNVQVVLASGRPRNQQVSLYDPQYIVPKSRPGPGVYVVTPRFWHSNLNEITSPPQPSLDYSYNLHGPFSLKAHHGAMVPFLIAQPTAHRAFAFPWPEGGLARDTIELTNPGPNALAAGVITVFAGNTYLGEGRIHALAANTTERFSFGTDDGLTIRPLDDPYSLVTQKSRDVHARNGTISVYTKRWRTRRFLVRAYGQYAHSEPLTLETQFSLHDDGWTAAGPQQLRCQPNGDCIAHFRITQPRQIITVTQSRTSTETDVLDAGAVDRIDSDALTPAAARRALAPLMASLRTCVADRKAIGTLRRRLRRLERHAIPLRADISVISQIHGQDDVLRRFSAELVRMQAQTQDLEKEIQEERSQCSAAKVQFQAAARTLTF